MKIIFVVTVLAAIAVMGTRVSYFNRNISMGMKNIILTGVEYIFAGFILGSHGLGLLDSRTIESMEPFLVFGICWVGFLVGLQLKVSDLKKMPRHYISITTITLAGTFIPVASGIYLAGGLFPSLTPPIRLFLALVLGAISCNTALSAIAILHRNYLFENVRVINLLRHVAGMDGVFSILIFTIFISLFTSGAEGPVIAGRRIPLALGTSLLLGIAGAFVLILLSRTPSNQKEFVLFVTGIVLFFGGYTSFTNLSPLFTGLVCGSVFANFSRHRMRALSMVIHSEKPVYIIMLLIVGASWDFSLPVLPLLAAVYIVSRTAGKTAGGFLSTRIFRFPHPVSPRLGMGLLSEGGLSIVMALSIKMIMPGLSNTVISILIISTVFNELFGPKLILSLFPSSQYRLRKIAGGKSRKSLNPE